MGVDAAGDVFLTNGTELSPTGQFDASATPATIVASSNGTGVKAFLPNAQVVEAVVVGGYHGFTQVEAQGFNVDGTHGAFFTPAFSYTGPQSAGHESAAGVAVEANRQVVIAGTSSNTTSVFGVARTNANGSLDTTFGNSGVLTTSFQGNDHAVAVLIQPDNGDIIAVGKSVNSAGVTDLALARYVG